MRVIVDLFLRMFCIWPPPPQTSDGRRTGFAAATAERATMPISPCLPYPPSDPGLRSDLFAMLARGLIPDPRHPPLRVLSGSRPLMDVFAQTQPASTSSWIMFSVIIMTIQTLRSVRSCYWRHRRSHRSRHVVVRRQPAPPSAPPVPAHSRCGHSISLDRH